MSNNLHSINAEQRLYVLNCGEGYSCLGFDVAERKAKAVAKWLLLPTPSDQIKQGTEAGYAEYLAIMDRGSQVHKETGRRCNVELVPQLKGLEGQWVWVEEKDGETRIFKVGKSAGWMPCHLEIEPPDLTGGIACMSTKFKRVMVLQ